VSVDLSVFFSLYPQFLNTSRTLRSYKALQDSRNIGSVFAKYILRDGFYFGEVYEGEIKKFYAKVVADGLSFDFGALLNQLCKKKKL
jgi:hypothetical protein